MKIVYAQQPLPEICEKGIFLAGPTPRDEETKSWRPSALEILKNRNFDGYVFVPEMINGWSSNFEYEDQIEWEHNGLCKASVILFWVPRELKSMPALTTNIEWGYWVANNPDKLVLGYPHNAPKMNYMAHYAKKLNIPIAHSLDSAIDLAITR